MQRKLKLLKQSHVNVSRSYFCKCKASPAVPCARDFHQKTAGSEQSDKHGNADFHFTRLIYSSVTFNFWLIIKMYLLKVKYMNALKHQCDLCNIKDT